MKKKLETDQKTKVESFYGTGYNPLLQKPTTLEPINPAYPLGWGSYIYFGPPPDFGGTFGSFEDARGRKQVGIKTSKSYSIYDGSPVACKSELSPEDREILLSQLDEASESHKCQHCRSELVLSAGALLNVENLHCPFCASPLDGAMEKVNKCISKIEEITMKKLQVKAEVDVAKKAMEAPAPVDLNKDAKAVFKDAMNAPVPNDANEKVKAPADEKPLEHKEALKDVIEEKPIEFKEEQVKASAKTRTRMKRALASLNLETKKREKAIAAKIQKTPAKASAPAAVEETPKSVIKPVVTAKKGLNLSAEDMGKLTRELRVLAVKEPARFESVKKNKALASICAEVEAKLVSKEDRIAARAELKALASENPEQALALEEQLQFEAPEILVEQDEIVAPEAPAIEEGAPAVEPAPECVCEQPIEVAPAPEGEVAPPAETEAPVDTPVTDLLDEAKTESMEVEFLESNLSEMKAEKVEMSLHGETTANPFWNVTVNAQPVGRIYLQDQENYEAIRAAFIEDSYAQNFGNAMVKAGVEKMMTVANAKFFAHKMDESAMAKRIEAKVREEVKAEVSDKVATLRADFLDAVATAMVASDKNFYGAEENANVLKGQLFNNIISAGVEYDVAVSAVVEGFAKAPEYFDFIISKAMEIMDMSKDSRETFTKTVLASGTLDLVHEKEPSMADLVQASKAGQGRDEIKASLRRGLKRY